MRRVPPDALIEDHPSRVGCYVLEASAPDNETQGGRRPPLQNGAPE
jgi:hypothetical protein